MPVTLGTSYTFYVVDTTSGTALLPNPLIVTVTETICVDRCDTQNALRCTGELLETCALQPTGCLDWQQTSDCAATGLHCNAATGTPQCLACQDTCPKVADLRCNATAVEQCTVQPSGCADWTVNIDCASMPGAVCDDTMGAPNCVLSTGEDCASSYILRGGANSVAWTAANADYLTSPPSCSSQALAGPDLVLRYTSTLDGFIEFSMAKPTSTRYSIVVSDAACGTLTPQLICKSEYSLASMGATIPVTEGTTYYFYLRDTTSGTAALPQPIAFTINELLCLDVCTVPNATQCDGDFLESCQTNSLGCLDWKPVTDCVFEGGLCDNSTGLAQCVPCIDNCEDGDTRCTHDTAEACVTTAEGCLDWLPGTHCPSLGQVCFDGGALAHCSGPVAESCSSAYVLSQGTNSIDWVAFDRDYLVIAPPCQSAGGVTGPDLVLQYTAQSTGFVDLSLLDKPSGSRFTYVVSASACGTLAPQIACLSESVGTVLSTTFAASAGATYTIYVVDTTVGTGPLPNPLVFEVRESSCPQGLSGNRCPAVGDTSCYAAVVEGHSPAAAIADSTGSATTCGHAGAVADSITVTETELIDDVNVKVNITHTYDSEMDIFLGFVDGAGTSHCVELGTDNGSSSDNFFNTVFDDEALSSITTGSAPFAGSYRPEGSLAVLEGLPMNGTWTLYVNDDGSGDTGMLNSWELTLAHAGTQIQTCNLQATGCLDWTPGVDCAATSEYCSAAGGSAQCLTCEDTCPSAGMTRCTDGRLESCTVNAEGCYDWTLATDCAAAGDVCQTTGEGAACITPVAEDCASAAVLGFGSNTITWNASNREYLIDEPSCQSSYDNDGPDLVLSHTATYSGPLTFTLNRTSTARFTVVVSDAACGTVSPALVCKSDSASTPLKTTIDAVQGTTYYFYLTDTTSGTATLPNPLAITLSCEHSCEGYDQRCVDDVIQSCTFGPSTCLEWVDTTDCSLTGLTCDEGLTPSCEICTDLCPGAGTTRCNGAAIETCGTGALGCLDWLLDHRL